MKNAGNEKLCKNVFDQEPVSKTYKELLKLKNNETI